MPPSQQEQQLKHRHRTHHISKHLQGKHKNKSALHIMATAALVGRLGPLMPNIDAFLGRFVKGTNFLGGGAEDYVLSAGIALAFPLMRLILDRTVYDVRCTHQQPKTSGS